VAIGLRAALIAAFLLVGSFGIGRAGFFPPMDTLDGVADKADMVLVVKHRRVLLLLRQGHILKSYSIMLGFEPRGTKLRQGDGRTPEGIYWIDGRNAESAYHLSLHISYPDMEDLERARGNGIPPGGNIMIHGLPNGYVLTSTRELQKNWTDGCIAVTNHDIEEIWNRVDDGTPIEIDP
jgi:murein L,D-transpeptidase YafK